MKNIAAYFKMTSYGVHERYVLRETTLRAAEVIEEELEHMEKTNLDWSNWDDTRLYMMGKVPEYVEENMMNITFTNLGINMMILVDTNGEIKQDKRLPFHRQYPQ